MREFPEGVERPRLNGQKKFLICPCPSFCQAHEITQVLVHSTTLQFHQRLFNGSEPVSTSAQGLEGSVPSH